jgi:hypothetical protein
MSQVAVLDWIEVEDVAKEAFSVWTDQPELAWVEMAWDVIVKAGLADYHVNDDIERCRAAIRFFALCGIYLDFCQYAWGAGTDTKYVEWAEALEILPFRVGQLLGLDPGYPREWNAQSLLDNGLTHLANKSRKSVVEALLLALGGKTELFLSLWMSCERAPTDWLGKERTFWSPSLDYNVLNYDMSIIGPAFTWIDQGCPP